MAPNLYILLRTLVSPGDWVAKRRKDSSRDSVVLPGQPLARTEHWKSPVPGVYRYCLGSGWYLIQLDSNPSQPETPDHVIYCEPLHRSLLESEYNKRSVKARLPLGCTPSASRSASPTRPQGNTNAATSRKSSRQEERKKMRNFIRHDDGVTWLNDKDADGNTTKGPWQRFCYNPVTGEMRVMMKGDCTAHSRNGSVVHNTHPSTRGMDSKGMITSIKAIAPELDGIASNAPSFLGPRSLAGSSGTSRRTSTETSRPTSLRTSSDTSIKMQSPQLSEIL